MKYVVIKFRYSTDGEDMIIPGDSFDMHDDFVYIGCKREVVGMVRTESVTGIFITDASRYFKE
jgi:hypothetical protein